ncbi:MAG: helix-turn-helix domain-containing protein [Dehalococcoidia bacterium]
MLMTVKEAATYLRCHTSTVYRLLREKRLPGVKVGNQWRIDGDLLASRLGIEMTAPTDGRQEVSGRGR